MALTKDVYVDIVLAATGTNQATAASIHSAVVWPTAASTDGTKGIKLPANATTGTIIFVGNRSGGANNLNVYSSVSTGYIDATAGSTANTIAQNKSKIYVCVDGANDKWISVAGA